MAKARKPARVRTAEGVEKYNAPKGSLITRKPKEILARLNARLVGLDNTNQGTLPGMKPKQLGLFSVPEEPKIPKPKPVDPTPKKPKAAAQPKPGFARADQLGVGDFIVRGDGDYRITAAQRGSNGSTQFALANPDGGTSLSAIYQPETDIVSVRIDQPGELLGARDIDVQDIIIAPDGSKNRVLSVARSRFGDGASFRVERPDGSEYSVPVDSYDRVRAIRLTPEEREAWRNRPRTWEPNMETNAAWRDFERGDIVFLNGRKFELDQVKSPSTSDTKWDVIDEDGNRISNMQFLNNEPYQLLRFGNDNDARQAWFREHGFVEGSYADLQPGDEIVAPQGLPFGGHSGRQAIVRIDDNENTGGLTVFASRFPDDVGDVMRVEREDSVIRRPGGGNKSERVRSAMQNRRASILDYERNFVPTKSKDLRVGDSIKLSHDGEPLYVVAAKYDPDLDEVTWQTLSPTGSVMTMMREGDLEWRVKAGGGRTEVDEYLTVENARLDGLRNERSAAPTIDATELEEGDVVYWNDALIKYRLTGVRQAGDGTANITMEVIDGDHSIRVGERFGQRVGGTAEFHRVESGAEIRAARIQQQKEEADVERGENIIANDIVYDPITKSWARVQSVEEAPDGNLVVRGYLSHTTSSRDEGSDYLLTVAPDSQVRMRERNADQVRAAARNIQQRERRIAQREAEAQQAIEDAKMAGKPTPNGVSTADLRRDQVIDLLGDGVPVRVTDIERQGNFVTITGYNTAGPNKGVTRIEGSTNPNDTFTTYPDHAERALPPLPPEAAQQVAAKEIAVGDKLVFTTTQTSTTPTRPVAWYPSAIPEGAILPEYGNATFLEVVREGSSSYDDTIFRVRESDGGTAEISVPARSTVRVEGEAADAVRARERNWYGGETVTVDTQNDVRVDSTRVLANGKIRVKGEYITGPKTGEKYSDLLPPNSEHTVLRQPRNSNGELLNARQAERLRQAEESAASAQRIYDRAILYANTDMATHGIRQVIEEAATPGTIIELGRFDGFGARRPDDLGGKQFTVVSATPDPDQSAFIDVEMTDDDGDLYELKFHRNETVRIFGDQAAAVGRARADNSDGVFRDEQAKALAELREKIDNEGTWGGITPPRRRSLLGNAPNDRYRGKPWSGPESFQDIADMSELFSMDEDELFEELQKMDGAWGDGEVTLEMQSAKNYGDEIFWHGNLYMEGRKVGYIKRKYRDDGYGELSVYNDYLWIDDSDAKGHGVATVFYAEMEDWYRRSGVNRMEIQAVQDGAYAWGMAGFDWWPGHSQNDDATDSMASRLNAYLHNHGVTGGIDNGNGYGFYNGHELDSDGEYYDSDKGEYVRPDPDDVDYGTDGDSAVSSGDLPQELAEQLVDMQRRLASSDDDDWPTPNEIATLRYDTGEVYPDDYFDEKLRGQPKIENIGKLVMRDQNWFGQYFF